MAPLARVVRGGYFPYVVLAGGEGDVPLLRDRGPVDGQAAAYVCEHFTCRLPVTMPMTPAPRERLRSAALAP